MYTLVLLELAPKNVRVNSVNPGVVVTELQKRGGLDDVAYAKVRVSVVVVFARNLPNSCNICKNILVGMRQFFPIVRLLIKACIVTQHVKLGRNSFFK